MTSHEQICTGSPVEIDILTSKKSYFRKSNSCFLYELKLNLAKNLFKKYFHGEMDEKRIFFKYCCQHKCFSTLVHQYLISVVMKNDKISHFENFNHMSYLTADLV